MSTIPSYGKILTIGSPYTNNALKGEVVVQEKVDGSQFRFGINDKREFVASSKGAALDLDQPQKQFSRGVEYLKSLDAWADFAPDTYFYGEILDKPRHNILAYDRTPTNHIVIFDALSGGEYASRADLELWASRLGVDAIPELYRGDDVTVDMILDLVKTHSYLGGQIIEGVVIKNYTEKIQYSGKEQQLFTKYVREEFKEMNSKNPDFTGGENKAIALFTDYCAEARWHKAVQHLRDADKLTGSPKDIGLIIKEVPADIISENESEIKDKLFDLFRSDFAKIVTRGLPEWYKKQLFMSDENKP